MAKIADVNLRDCYRFYVDFDDLRIGDIISAIRIAVREKHPTWNPAKVNKVADRHLNMLREILEKNST